MKQTETIIRLMQIALKTAQAPHFVGRRQAREKAFGNAQGVRLP